jgi:hypothetical protein
MDVTCHASVDDFFHEVVTDALEAVHLEATSITEWYLVALLGDFTRARIPDEPLAVKLAGSRTAEPGARVKTLKEVGDTSLYVAGFFAESLDHKLVDVDYYVGLGTTAYGELAGRLGGNLTQVYRELASSFPRFVDVLAEVRRRVDFASSDVVKLYEIWLGTRDEWVEKKLRSFGVFIDPGTTKVQ